MAKGLPSVGCGFTSTLHLQDEVPALLIHIHKQDRDRFRLVAHVGVVAQVDLCMTNQSLVFALAAVAFVFAAFFHDVKLQYFSVELAFFVRSVHRRLREAGKTRP